MNMNNIGKFEMRNIVEAFDAALIRLYGCNMLDAAITRYEALSVCSEFHSPGKAAEAFGRQRGLDRLSSGMA